MEVSGVLFLSAHRSNDPAKVGSSFQVKRGTSTKCGRILFLINLLTLALLNSSAWGQSREADQEEYGPVASSKPAAAETQPLQGAWEGVLAGRDAAGKVSILFTGNSLHFQGLDTNEWYDATFTLPPGTEPQQLHATIKACPRRDPIGKVVLAIFKIEEGKLTLVGREGVGLEPPKSFDGEKVLPAIEANPLDEPQASEGVFRYEFKKVPSRKQPAQSPIPQDGTLHLDK
jgi:uncharacterized protein (TIGR03067 family)